jgi:hypothetical protein
MKHFSCFNLTRLLASSFCLLTHVTAAYSDVVDLYNSATGAWSIAQLSLARGGIAATSVGSIALFAGGWTSGAHICVKEAIFPFLSVEMMAMCTLITFVCCDYVVLLAL